MEGDIMSTDTTSLNIRMDKALKEQADKLFGELGLNMSTAVNIFIRAAVREHGIPFDVSLDIPNAKTLAAMDDAEHDRNMHGPFHSVDDLMRDLDA
jgi:DNA-damage-inducible protein J